jgi:hypothetical protein
MQSVDSVLLLIGLNRYPHALATCASAIESVIKASRVGIALGRSGGPRELIDAARNSASDLAAFPKDALDHFRKARNRITHYGFSPKDDPESVGLLIEVGFPFLGLCFRHLHGFDLWEGLEQDFVAQFEVAQRVYERAKGVEDLDASYCLNSLVHLIRWRLKDNFSARWELEAIADAESSCSDSRIEQTRTLELRFGASWTFDCPLCEYPASAVTELQDSELGDGNIIPARLVCTNCGFVVRQAERFLGEEVLQTDILKFKDQILKEFGVKAG